MVTKGNKKFAGSAGIRESVKVWAIARRAFIYAPQRVTEANLESGARYRVRTCDFLRVKQALYR